MTYPVDVYSVGSGQSIYGGRHVLPPWVPAPGTFANISKNTMNSVRPSSWGGGSDTSGPFSNWCGAVYSSDYSNLGAFTVHGSGDLVRDAVLWAGVWHFNLDTLLWEGSNVPPTPMYESSTAYLPGTAGSYFDTYAEGINPPNPVGHTYPAHTYQGMIYQPASLGGSSKGSLIRVCIGGGSRRTHRFDLSKPSDPAQRIFDNFPIPTAYPQAARDTARAGFWALSTTGAGPLVFVKFSDLSVTSYPSVQYNVNGNNTMVYVPAPWDMIVCFGEGGPYDYNPSYMIYYSRIVNGVPQPFEKVTSNVSGTYPTDRRSGGVWSTILNCIVAYESAGSNRVHSLTLPDPATNGAGIWAWANETVVGVAGATPSHTSGVDNGAWGRFIEVPKARCFIWCDGVNAPTQAWRLARM